MTRSQMAFIRGVLGNVEMTRSPSALNTSSNAAVNSMTNAHANQQVSC